MLGWNISVYRQADGGGSPATVDAERGSRLAVWQTGLAGLEWIDQLVAAGHAVDFGGGGYPNRYSAVARHLIPPILAGPPEANKVWTCGLHDIIGPGWEGRTVIDQGTVDNCRPDEWLFVEAWDES